ncbi:MAG: hypothetical protein JW892_08580 [Anaerolineae bacterium]|nr:hypothetical protein [Anaerolineae bacterium]
MTEWFLDGRLGQILGIVFTAALILLVILMLGLAIVNPVSILTFVLGLGAIAALACAGFLAYWTWGLSHAAYTLDRNAIIIQWGAYERQVPLSAIQNVLTVADIQGLRLRGVLRWPGLWVGVGRAEGLNPIYFYASKPLTDMLFIQTAARVYAISPGNKEDFIAALRERQEMGPTQEVEESERHPAIFDWQSWRDPMIWGLLGSSILLWVLLLGLLTWRFPLLPPEIVLQTDAEGAPLLIAGASRIFYLALLGAIFLVLNGGAGIVFYRRERMLTRVLWLGLLLLQSSLWIAALSILLATA